ncbi:MAG: FecR family protein [bacterium]|nr:FecR family protein [bacterium]
MMIPQRDIDLIDGYCSGSLTDDDFSELESRLRESHELRQLLIEYRSIESAMPSALASGTTEKTQASATKKSRVIRRLKIALLTTAAGLLLLSGLYFLRPSSEPQIAIARSLTGSVRWTGPGGQVVDDVQAGRALTGGTIECLAVDSSADLDFPDGSTVSISGVSVLTISDDGHKKLHLREGNLSATVSPQPEGKPLRMLTPTAELEVLGTQFDVTAAETQTKITVNEGLVRVKRLTDGKFTDVKAEHSLVATIEAREPPVAIAMREPVSVWKANLGQDKTAGDWLPIAHALRIEIGLEVRAGELDADRAKEVYFKRLEKFEDDDGFLKAMPRRTGRKEQPLVYLISLNIPQRQAGPILLSDSSRLRVIGRSKVPQEVTFGIAAHNQDRTIKGRYGVARQVDPTFDIEIPIADLREHGRQTSAVGLEAFVFYCFVDKPGLEVTHVELVSSEE